MAVFKMSKMLPRSLVISVEGRPDDVVSVGQCILIEGDDDDSPYVARLLELFSDGKNRSSPFHTVSLMFFTSCRSH